MACSSLQLAKARRQRTGLACLSCRTRKCKCNGAKPICDTCSAMGFECVYRKSARGTRPARASVSEHNPSNVEQRLQNLEELLLSVTAAQAQLPVNSQEPLELSTNETSASSAPELQSQATPGFGSDEDVCQHALVGATQPGSADTIDGMGVIIFADEAGSRFFGETSNSGFTSHIHYALKKYATSRGYTHTSEEDMRINGAANVSRPPTPCSLPSAAKSVMNEVLSASHSLPSKAVVTRLVNLFFSEFGLMFPYINRQAVLDGVDNLAKHAVRLRQSWLCLLHVIMAFSLDYAARQEDGDRDLSSAHLAMQTALSLIPDVSQNPANVETLQALLLLTQYLQGTRSSSLFSHYQGLTVQIAFQIGAHCPHRFPTEDELDYEVRKRCWHMTFILDKITSLHFGRPSSIPSTYVEVPMPMDRDLDKIANDSGVPLEQEVSTTTGFIHTIKLFHILSDVLREVYQDNLANSRQAEASSLQIYQGIGLFEWKLQQWRDNLPAQLRIRTPSQVLEGDVSCPFNRLSIVLTLRYLFAKLLLHRVSLTRLLDVCARQARSRTEEYQGDIANQFFDKSEKASIEECVTTAMNIINIMIALSDSRHRMLMSWWFSIYYVFSAVLVIFATLIAQRQHSTSVAVVNPENLRHVFPQALHLIHYLAPDALITSRCHKYIQRLEEIAITLGLFTNEILGDWDGTITENCEDLFLGLPELFPPETQEDMGNFMTFHHTAFNV